MKLLFITTLNVPLEQEHFFTKNVYEHLLKISDYENIDISLTTIYLSNKSIQQPEIIEQTIDNRQHYKCFIGNKSQKDIVDVITRLMQQISPDVIHSNMIEGYDILAAQALGIPIVITMHIGGLICPRGGGNGFLNYKDQICDRAVSTSCAKCMLNDLPFPSLAHFLYSTSSLHLRKILLSKIGNKNVFYLSPLLSIDKRIEERIHIIETLSYAHLILANEKLVKMAKINGLSDKIHLLQHGVAPRQPLPIPSIDGKIKFYILGRIQYSKGIHNIIRAFDNIAPHRYELHIIGDAESARREQRYWQWIQKLAHGKNIIFHGRLPNNEIEHIIKDCHVMIHGTICLEVYGIAIAESLSLGRPVLATRCGGAEMQINDYDNGWLVKPNDVEDMHKTILAILDNPNDIMIKAKRTKLPMPISTYAKKLVSLYQKIYDTEK